MNDDVVMIDEVDLENSNIDQSIPLTIDSILDNEAVSIRLLVYEDSRSILWDIPFTERNIDSDGSEKNFFDLKDFDRCAYLVFRYPY